jgi:NAD(P)-dependent dehydrogenase (short-subunit alcohol dehydrogenase family)
VTDESAGSEPRPTFLVTGATSGIGEAIAMQLSEHGARVLMGARTPERGRVAADRVRTRVPDADLQVAAADLSLMQEVRSLAYQIMDSTPRLDGLILNAAEAHSDLVLLSDQQALEHLVRPGTREAPAAHGHHRQRGGPGFRTDQPRPVRHRETSFTAQRHSPDAIQLRKGGNHSGLSGYVL